MPVKSMQDLFVQELQDIFHAEKQLVRALPKLAKAASHEELREALRMHLDQTKGQVERLEQVFETIDKAPRGKRCEAMEGLISEGNEVLEEIEDEQVRDVALIVAAQKVEHYEIASYGSLAALARQLGHDEAVTLLEQTLEEEKETDQKLNELALSLVNPEAEEGEESDEFEDDDEFVSDEGEEEEEADSAPAQSGSRSNAKSGGKKGGRQTA